MAIWQQHLSNLPQREEKNSKSVPPQICNGINVVLLARHPKMQTGFFVDLSAGHKALTVTGGKNLHSPDLPVSFSKMLLAAALPCQGHFSSSLLLCPHVCWRDHAADLSFISWRDILTFSHHI